MKLPGNQYRNGNHHALITISGNKYFVKSVPAKDYRQEVGGSLFVSKYFPTPKLVSHFMINGSGVLIYEAERSVGKNSGLLVDLFAQNKKLVPEFRRIIEMFSKVFLENRKFVYPTSSKVFFEDRVEKRLEDYYSSSFIKKYSSQKIKVNGWLVTLNLEKVLHQTKKHFSVKKKYWSVPSQADPSDLNIATKLLIFDHLAGGWVPVMAEFASLFWYNLAQGQRLALIYNQGSFANHNEIYKKQDEVSVKGLDITHHPSPLRKEFLGYYIAKVINPFLEITGGGYPGWYEDFKFFLTLRILGVFNVSGMEKNDLLLSLGYLGLFHSLELAKPDELLEYI